MSQSTRKLLLSLLEETSGWGNAGASSVPVTKEVEEEKGSVQKGGWGSSPKKDSGETAGSSTSGWGDAVDTSILILQLRQFRMGSWD